jgi:hypothetical protein
MIGRVRHHEVRPSVVQNHDPLGVPDGPRLGESPPAIPTTATETHHDLWLATLVDHSHHRCASRRRTGNDGSQHNHSGSSHDHAFRHHRCTGDHRGPRHDCSTCHDGSSRYDRSARDDSSTGDADTSGTPFTGLHVLDGGHRGVLRNIRFSETQRGDALG